jgi:hypothetical protein
MDYIEEIKYSRPQTIEAVKEDLFRLSGEQTRNMRHPIKSAFLYVGSAFGLLAAGAVMAANYIDSGKIDPNTLRTSINIETKIKGK